MALTRLNSDLVSIETGGTLKDTLSFVTPEMMRISGSRYLQGVTPDAQPFVQAAVDYGKQHNLPVKLLTTYTCTTAPHRVELPRDDGTVYPKWITDGTDVNIAPEAAQYMPACIRLYNDSRVFGENMQTCGISGSWSKANGPYDNTAPIGVFISGNGGKDDYVRYHLENLTISNFFIGRLCEGTSAFSTEDNIKVMGCGITGVFQGEDAIHRGFMLMWYNIAGDVRGGWWLTRNHAYATTFMPPYPGKDIHRAGWNDSSYTEKYHYYGDTSLNWTHPCYSAVDQFFDRFFFKSVNSAKTSAGGRLSNSTQPGVWPVGVYRGVAGRALTIYSRYGREIMSCNIGEAKIMWSPRTPFFYTSQPSGLVGNSKIGHCMLERVGIIEFQKGDTAGNRFNVDNVDPYDSEQAFFPAMATRGNIFCEDIIRSGAVQKSVGNELQGAFSGSMQIQCHRRVDDAANYSMLRLQEWKNSLTDRYVFNSKSCLLQPAQFDSSGALFKYFTREFTPTIKIGGQAIDVTEAKGICHRFGDVVRIRLRFRNPNLSLKIGAGGGAIEVGGLPFQAAPVQWGGTFGSVTLGAQAAGFTLIPQVVAGSTTVRFLKDSSGAQFQHPSGDFDFTLHADFEYTTPFNA